MRGWLTKPHWEESVTGHPGDEDASVPGGWLEVGDDTRPGHGPWSWNVLSYDEHHNTVVLASGDAESQTEAKRKAVRAWRRLRRRGEITHSC